MVQELVKINKEKCNKFFKSYDRHIQQEYDKSTETALLEESASYYDEKFGEIDARHGWRKNAKDSNILAIGEKPTKFCHVSMQLKVMMLYHKDMNA